MTEKLARLREELATWPINGSFSNGSLADYFEGIQTALEKAGILRTPAPADEGVEDAIKDGLDGWIGISDLDEAARSIALSLKAHRSTPPADEIEAVEGLLAEALAKIAYEHPEEPWRIAHDALKQTARPLSAVPRNSDELREALDDAYWLIVRVGQLGLVRNAAAPDYKRALAIFRRARAALSPEGGNREA